MTLKVNIFSLKYRIALIVFLLELVMLTFVLQRTLGFIESSISKDFEERQEILYNTIAFTATEALFSEEFDSLQREIELIAESTEVELVQVYREDEIVIAHSDFMRVGTPVTHRHDPSYVIKSGEIDGLGTVEIVFNQVRHQQRISEAKQLGITIAVTGIVIILIASLLFGHLLTRKLDRLSVAMKSFKDGEKDINIPVEGKVTDEVSSLGTTFNVMAADIRKHVHELNLERALLEERVKERTAELQAAKDKLEVLATTDHLTRLKNRAYVEAILKSEIGRYSRTGVNFSIVLMDIDHFKNINDTYGHDAGDEVLKIISSIMKESVREIDVIGRWGGEEFMIICPSTDAKGAGVVAENIRTKVEDYNFPEIGVITVSAGVSTTQEKDRMDSLIKRADIGLYEAKEGGRNKVVLNESSDLHS